MLCPKCGATTCEVIDSRPSENNSVRRRRECKKCGHRFTSYEITVEGLKENNEKIRSTIKESLLKDIDKEFNRPITALELHARKNK